ncbi:MAG TPA: SBBP repeat-containing protein, partial [Allocoleopsis sp.]
GNSVYITGQTQVALPGNSYAGNKDAFVAKYSSDGARQWVRQFGTSGLEEAQTIAVDNSGRIYVAGETNQSLFGSYYAGSDAWVAVYDSNGNRLKGLQIGTLGDDEIYGATITGNSLYLIGQTEGSFSGFSNQGSYDAWVAQYDLTLI